MEPEQTKTKQSDYKVEFKKNKEGRWIALMIPRFPKPSKEFQPYYARVK